MRRNRSVLSVPAGTPRMIEKAASLPADLVLLDLEDAVVPDLKVEARQGVIHALTELTWGDRPPAYRCNGLDTPYFYRDIIDIVEAAGSAAGTIVVPKVNRAEDLIVVDTLLHGIELSLGLTLGSIKLHALIESAQGLINVERIALATPRLEALVFGPGDYAASIGMPMESIGVMDAWDEAYPGHRLHYAMQRIVVAARAAGLRAIDGPVANYRDREGHRRSCTIARSLGFDGKWCIHPDQLAATNEIFSPTERELSWARRVIQAYEEAVAAGRGAVSIDGTMIDVASIRLAEATIDAAQ
jgi:citrate lyase subunit beta / citryl-CoA lyase